MFRIGYIMVAYTNKLFLPAVTQYRTVSSTVVVILYVSHVTSSWTSWTCQQWLQGTLCFHGNRLDPIRCGMIIPFQLYGWCCSCAVRQPSDKLQMPGNFNKPKWKQRTMDSCKANFFCCEKYKICLLKTNLTQQQNWFRLKCLYHLFSSKKYFHYRIEQEGSR